MYIKYAYLHNYIQASLRPARHHPSSRGLRGEIIYTRWPLSHNGRCHIRLPNQTKVIYLNVEVKQRCGRVLIPKLDESKLAETDGSKVYTNTTLNIPITRSQLSSVDLLLISLIYHE